MGNQMDRIEFIDELKRCLKGKVDDAELQRQIDYYTSYIISECSTGVKEDVVIEALGDPRLIAKTIVQTYNMNDNPIKNQYQGYQEFREEDQADVPEHVFARDRKSVV